MNLFDIFTQLIFVLGVDIKIWLYSSSQFLWMIINELVVVFDTKLLIGLQNFFLVLIQKLLQLFTLSRVFFEIISCLKLELV